MAMNPSGELGEHVRLTTALEDFQRAHRRAALNEVMGRLQGKPVELLSFSEVSRALQVAGQAERGVHEIRVDQIVGSVGRYQDFDRSFLPRNKENAQRWAHLLAVAPDLTTLPPIEVYQIGSAYFVIDGNHRVSLAHHLGREFITAQVTEVRTRAPLPEELDPLHLVLAAEYAAFLERTRLDRYRPAADVQLSLPGRYEKLENHMEVHRFFIEMAEDRALSDSEAVTRWYDEAYLPVVETIREQGLLRGFHGRTEADLYLWIAENQAALRNELGWHASPQAAAAQVRPPGEKAMRGLLGRLVERVQRSVRLTADLSPRAALPWSGQKTLDRYSQMLFGDLLVLLAGMNHAGALAQAARLAHAEEATVHGLLLAGEGTDTAVARAQFQHYLEDAGLQGSLAIIEGDWLVEITRRVPLADLVVVCPSLLEVDESLPEALLQESVRPLLFTSGQARPLRRALLLLDGRARAHEALFAGVYMAEAWGTELVLLCDPAMAAAPLEEAQRYLELHECVAVAQLHEPLSLAGAQAAARAYDCDVIICAGYDEAPLSKKELGRLLRTQWLGSERPWLVCP